jgi:hypothetical protein
MVRLDTAVQGKRLRRDLLASYSACYQADLSRDLTSSALRDIVNWILHRNLCIGKLLVDEKNIAVLHLLADNHNRMTGEIVLHLHFGESAWDLFLQQDNSACLLPRISELHLRCARSRRPDYAPPTLSLQLCHLKSLSCGSDGACFTKVIQYNPLLSMLRLSVDTYIPDRLLAAIVGRRETLRTLELVGSHVTDADLQEIGGACNFLTDFSLDCLVLPNKALEVTDAGVCAILKGCPRLENLSVVCSAVTGTALAFALAHCPRLECISMRNMQLDDHALPVRPRNASPLRKLACRWGISSLDVSEGYFHPLCGIVELSVALEKFCMETLDVALHGMPLLRRLALRPYVYQSISVEVLHIVAQACTQLTALCVTGDVRGDAELALIGIARANPGLAELCKSRGVKGFTDAVVLALAEHCPELTTLRVFCSANLSDSSLTALARGCRKLAELSLPWCTQLTDRTLLALAAICAFSTSRSARRSGCLASPTWHTHAAAGAV